MASAALLYVAWVATCGGVRRVGLPPRGESTKSTRSVLLLGDLHIAGPELELDAESNPMDSISVLKAASRLYRVLEQRRKHEPSLVLVLGDVVHDGLRVLEDPNSAASLQRDLFDKAVNGYTIASGLFAEFLPGARIMVCSNLSRFRPSPSLTLPLAHSTVDVRQPRRAGDMRPEFQIHRQDAARERVSPIFQQCRSVCRIRRSEQQLVCRFAQRPLGRDVGSHEPSVQHRTRELWCPAAGMAGGSAAETTQEGPLRLDQHSLSPDGNGRQRA